MATTNNNDETTIIHLSINDTTILANDPIIPSAFDDNTTYTNDHHFGFVIAFAILSVSFLIAAFVAYKQLHNLFSRYTSEQEWESIQVLFPWICVVMFLECTTLSFEYYKALDSFVVIVQPNIWSHFVFILQSTIAPCLFITSFAITYLAHKTRSMPFFGVYYPEYSDNNDDNNNNNDNNNTSTAASRLAFRRFKQQKQQRLFLLLVAVPLVLFAMNFAVHMDIIDQGSKSISLAGRTGWLGLLNIDYKDGDNVLAEFLHIVTGLLPMTIVSFVTLYFAVLLWRYGSTYSLILYESFINPWVTPMLGSVIMLDAYIFFDEIWFPLMSNIGILCYVICMVRLVQEIQKEVETSNDLGQYLNVVTGGSPPAPLGPATEETRLL